MEIKGSKINEDEEKEEEFEEDEADIYPPKKGEELN